MLITKGLGKRKGFNNREDMETIVKKVIESINQYIENRGWNHRELAKRLKRPGDKDLTKEDEEKRIKRNEVWLSRKIGKNVKETRDLTVDDLNIIARGLDALPSDFFPKRLEDEICRLPLAEFIKSVCRNEIKHYLEKNDIKTEE